MNKAGDLLYTYLFNIIEKYQHNYKGTDKMSREYMMGEIKRFKKGDK